MRKIKVQNLTEKAFSPFGQVITTEGREYSGEPGVYRWYEKQAQVDGADTVSINLLTAAERDFVCKKFEAHSRTTETLLPLTGDMIVAGVPVGPFDPNLLQAFYVPVGKGVCWMPGSWHYAPYSLSGDATCAIIFRHGTGADDALFMELPEEVLLKP
jgi:ureidoglycolate lyase